MSNILTTIETDIEAGVSVLKVVWQAATGEIASVLEADANQLVSDSSTLLVKLLPDEWAVVKQYGLQILGDAFDGDFAKAETDLLNALEAAGYTFMTDMGSPLIQLALAMLKAL